MLCKHIVWFLAVIGFVKILVADDQMATKRLFAAVRVGNAEEAEMALKDSANVTERGIRGYTPMHIAADRKYQNIVRLLLRYGADVNVSDNIGDRPLHLATRFDDVPFVTFLVEHGADLNIPGSFGYAPVRIAAQQGSLRVVEWLLEHGAHVSDIVNFEVFKNEPLLYFILTGTTQQAKDLLMGWFSSPEPINQNIFNRAFSLMVALYQEQLVDFVLESGLQHIDEDGWKMALEAAGAIGNRALFEKLYDALRSKLLNAALSNENFSMIVENALYWAATMGHETIVAFILQRAFVFGDALNLPLLRVGEHLNVLLASRASMSEDQRSSLIRIWQMLATAARQVRESGIRRPTLTPLESSIEALSRTIPPELIALVVSFLLQPIHHKPA